MRHPHGTHTAYVVDHCRCPECKKANSEYERRRHYCTWKPYVDAAPARKHVRRLQRQGMGWKRIASEAGLSASVVWKLLYGDPSRGMGPSKRIRPKTEAAILSVRPVLAPGARIDAAETWERIYDLMAMGYSKAAIARMLGRRTDNLQIGREKVSVRNAEAVEKLHASLTTPNRPEDKFGKIAANRARNYAARQNPRRYLASDAACLAGLLMATVAPAYFEGLFR